MFDRLHKRGVLSVFALCAISLCAFVGCKKDAQQNPDDAGAENGEVAAPQLPVFSDEIRSLSPEQLKARGELNSLPTEYVLPGAYYAQAIDLEKLSAIPKGETAAQFFAENGLQLPVEGLIEKSKLVLYSKGFAFVEVKDAKNNDVLQTGAPFPSEALYLTSDEPFDKDAIIDVLFKDADATKLSTKNFGGLEVRMIENDVVMPLDQAGTVTGKVSGVGAAVAFPTEKSVVFLTGLSKTFEDYFSAKKGDERGVAAQCLARAPIDKSCVVFEYDVDFASPNAQLVQLPVPLTEALYGSATKNLSTFEILFAGSESDNNLMTVKIFCKSGEGAENMKQTLSGALLETVNSLKEAIKRSSNPENANANGLIEMIKSAKLDVNGDVIVASVANNETFRRYILDQIAAVNAARRNSESFARNRAIEQTLAQLNLAMTRYSRENKTLPHNIYAEDGTPLLSWRVALLPTFGDTYKALYEKFNLNEPWNSETNLKLLEQIPPIYTTTEDPANKFKTQFLIFSTPQTPFGSHPEGLKVQDVADPYNTISIFFAASKHAVPWTQPEEVVFNPTKPTDVFGDHVCALTLMGEVVSQDCEDTEDDAKKLASLIYGVEEEPEDKTEGAAPSESAESTEAAPADDANATESGEAEPAAPTVDEPATEPASEPASETASDAPAETSAE